MSGLLTRTIAPPQPHSVSDSHNVGSKTELFWWCYQPRPLRQVPNNSTPLVGDEKNEIYGNHKRIASFREEFFRRGGSTCFGYDAAARHGELLLRRAGCKVG